MEHLRKRSGVQHAIDAVKIMSDMKQYFYEEASIPVYINMMDKATKKAAHAKLSISNGMLVAIATKSILVSDRFSRTTDAWEYKNDVDKTWSEWKETYLAAHESRENRLRDAGDTGGHNFGMANSATTPTSDCEVVALCTYRTTRALERIDKQFAIECSCTLSSYRKPDCGR